MIVAMQETASEEQVQQVVEHLIRMGFSVHRTTGERQTVLAAVGGRVGVANRNHQGLLRVGGVHRASAPPKTAGGGFCSPAAAVNIPEDVTSAGGEVVG